MNGVIRILVHVIGSYLQRLTGPISARELLANDVIMQGAVLRHFGPVSLLRSIRMIILYASIAHISVIMRLKNMY